MYKNFMISQKAQYGLRAVYELARQADRKSVQSVAELARIQAIPPRFLELILAELRQAGLVSSKRGPKGGYLLAVPATEISVGQILRFFDGPIGPVRCVTKRGDFDCPLKNKCAFQGLWSRARKALLEVYDNTTFQDLVNENSLHKVQSLA